MSDKMLEDKELRDAWEAIDEKTKQMLRKFGWLPSHERPPEKRPTSEEIIQAHKDIIEEDNLAKAARDTPEQAAISADIDRRANLPSHDPEHLCGMFCDGQDGSNSYCARLRRKLFGDKRK